MPFSLLKTLQKYEDELKPQAVAMSVREAVSLRIASHAARILMVFR